MAPLTFVFDFDPAVSERQKNLEKAKARSHAARISWMHPRHDLSLTKQPHRRSAETRASRRVVFHLNIPPAPVGEGEILPVPRPFKGNSDPFHVVGIEITPDVNELLAFTRNVLLPGQYYNNYWRRASTGSSRAMSSRDISSMISRVAAARDWEQTLDSLKSECAVLARLSGYASVMATVNPHLQWAQTLSLTMRQKSLRLLREALAARIASGKEDISEFLPPLEALFHVACMEENLLAAEEHGKILRRIFEGGTFTVASVIHVLYKDVDFAMKKGHRTFLDVDQWCPNALAGLSELFASMEKTQPLVITVSEVHPCVEYEPLRRLWLRQKDILYHLKNGTLSLEQYSDDQTAELVFGYTTAKFFVDCGQLNNMFHDLLDAAILPDSSAAQRYTLAGMLAALQYMVRRMCVECVINGIDIHDASNKPMEQLQHCTKQAYEASSLWELHGYAEAHLWMAFAGALEEHRRFFRKPVSRSGDRKLVSETWFAARLRDQAKILGVYSWNAMRTIAEQFFFADFFEPDGSLWFEDLIGFPSQT